MSNDNRRKCANCGRSRPLALYPKRGRGLSRVCEPCLKEMEVQPVTEPTPAPPSLVEMTKTSAVSCRQALLFAKECRRTAHELRGIAQRAPEGTQDLLASAAKTLDRAAAQIELLVPREAAA